jgi:hypothetical protein
MIVRAKKTLDGKNPTAFRRYTCRKYGSVGAQAYFVARKQQKSGSLIPKRYTGRAREEPPAR